LEKLVAEFDVISVADRHLNAGIAGETVDPFRRQAPMLGVVYGYFLRAAWRHRR
jgi:hypothetical protein